MNITKKWNYKQNLYSKTEWVRYYGEYIEAIEIILEQSVQSQVTVLALPTLFLIRHSLELAFKMNIIELAEFSKLEPKIDFSGKEAHVLHKLHDEFDKHVREIFSNKSYIKTIIDDFNSRNGKLKSFREIFDKLDNWSYSFRYPVEKDGLTKSFKPDDEINIAEIIPIYYETQEILKYTADVLLDNNNLRTSHKS